MNNKRWKDLCDTFNEINVHKTLYFANVFKNWKLSGEKCIRACVLVISCIVKYIPCVQKGIFFLLCILFYPKKCGVTCLVHPPLSFKRAFDIPKSSYSIKRIGWRKLFQEGGRRRKNQKGVTNSQLSYRKNVGSDKMTFFSLST